MKKLSVLLIVLALCLTLAGCGEEESIKYILSPQEKLALTLLHYEGLSTIESGNDEGTFSQEFFDILGSMVRKFNSNAEWFDQNHGTFYIGMFNDPDMPDNRELTFISDGTWVATFAVDTEGDSSVLVNYVFSQADVGGVPIKIITETSQAPASNVNENLLNETLELQGKTFASANEAIRLYTRAVVEKGYPSDNRIFDNFEKMESLNVSDELTNEELIDTNTKMQAYFDYFNSLSDIFSELLDEPIQEPITQAPTEPPTQKPTEAVTQAPTQPPTQAPTQPPTEAPTQAPASNVTMGQRNALQKAKDYLSLMSFSRNGLIKQLEFEKFSHEEAVYGADNSGADWNEQSEKKAKDYLNLMAFSNSGLIKQLEFDGFTNSQAVHGATNSGANWNEQAAKKAKDYLALMAFSRDSLITQLEFDGFTNEQAVYGVEANGY